MQLLVLMHFLLRVADLDAGRDIDLEQIVRDVGEPFGAVEARDVVLQLGDRRFVVEPGGAEDVTSQAARQALNPDISGF
ncbi:hypothetical protein [Bradyrhizobium sp. USDA 3315]